MENENTVNETYLGVLPWQSFQWDQIVKQTNSNTLAHAYLLNGNEGVGKRAFVRELSAYLLCGNAFKNSVSDSQACGQCKQCRLVKSESHPDYKFISPEGDGGKIKVDQVRQLVDFFSQSSQQGGRKIAVIEPAEALNLNAANALLKTLEEPSQNSVVILVSHKPGMLLPTIRSRCQVVDFAMPSAEKSLEWLAQKGSEFGIDIKNNANDIKEILALADSAPLKALKYIEENALSEYKRMLEELASFLKNEVISSSLASRWNDDISELRLAWMMKWVEQILKNKFTGEIDTANSSQKMFTYLSEKASNSELFDLYDQCLKQFQLFLGVSNPNKVLSFELLLHKWSSLMRKA